MVRERFWLLCGVLFFLCAGCGSGGSGGENGAPVADAGSDLVVEVGQVVHLDGSGSYDPDGDQLEFWWSIESKPQGSNAELDSPDARKPTFVPDVAGQYRVSLVVSDGELDSEPASVTVTATEKGTGGGWSAQYGGAGDEEMESISTAPDGGLVVAGISSSFSAGGDGDALVVKLNPDGSVAWAKTYGGAGEDMALDIKAAPDGGYIMAGWTESFGAGQSDCWLLKLDADGNVQWSKAFGGPGMEQAVYADPLPSGGYVVAGATTSFGAGDGDYWVLKIDSAGGVVWQKAYGGPLGDAPPNEYGEQVARAVVGADGNIVVASVSFSFGKGDGDVWVLKLDAADGSPVWQYAYGDAGEDSNWMLSRATGGGYLFSGSFVDVATQDPDVWVVKLAEDGTVEWQKTYGIAGVFDEALYHIPTSDGGVLVQAYVEQTSGDDWRSLLLKLDSSGTLAWSRVYRNGPVSWPNAAVEVSDGFYVVGVGIADVSVYDQQMWVFKIDSGGAITQNCQLGTAYEPVDRVPTAIATPTTATVTDTSSLATVTDTAVDAVPVTLAPRYDCH